MKVKDIEIRSGMDRSNIRFYEREGFIKPERLDNGYREYTEDDLNTLLWIRLLRSLQISLDDVRSLLADEKSMIEVIKNQVAGLEESKEDITYVQLICEKIRQSGSHISELNPDEYLGMLENRSITSENNYFVIKKDLLPQVFNPWTRFFARTIDLMIYVLLWMGIQVFYLHVPLVNKSIRGVILDVIMVILLMMIIEPISISITGTTIGKSIFGLRIRTYELLNLSYGDAFRRTYLVLVEGLGLLIPIYSIMRLYKSYKLCIEEEVLIWDEGLAYDSKERSRLRPVFAGGVYLILVMMFILVMKVQIFPPNRGELTLKEYTENFNYYQQLLQIDFAGYRLNDTGQWIGSADKAPYLSIGYLESPMMLYSYDDGKLDSVSFNINIQNKRQTLYTYNNHMLLSYLSLAGTQGKISLFSDFIEDIQSVVSHDSSEGFAHTIYNIGAISEIEQSGYMEVSSQFIVPSDDVEEYFYKVSFSVERVN